MLKHRNKLKIKDMTFQSGIGMNKTCYGFQAFNDHLTWRVCQISSR